MIALKPTLQDKYLKRVSKEKIKEFFLKLREEQTEQQVINLASALKVDGERKAIPSSHAENMPTEVS